MTNGTSGDINAIDFTSPRAKYAPFARMNQIAEDLAEKTAKLIDDMTFRSDATLGAAAEDLLLGVRKPGAKRLDVGQRASRTKGI